MAGLNKEPGGVTALEWSDEDAAQEYEAFALEELRAARAFEGIDVDDAERLAARGEGERAAELPDDEIGREAETLPD